jgi:hypothetical protein
MEDKKEILIMEELRPMFKEAIETNKWFYTNYQNLWFTPYELVKEQNDGRFRWGKAHWSLRDPYEALDQIEMRIQAVRKEYESFSKRITDWQIINPNNYSPDKR